MKISGVFDRGSLTGYNITTSVPLSMINRFEKIPTLRVSNMKLGEDGLYIVEGHIQDLKELFFQWTIPYSSVVASIKNVERVGGIWEITCEGISEGEVQIVLDDQMCLINELDFGMDKWKFRYIGQTTLADLMKIFS